MPLAEETGLIVPIGRWVLEEACSRAAAWNVAGHRVGISVKRLGQSAESRRLRHRRPARAAAVRDRALAAHARGRRDDGDRATSPRPPSASRRSSGWACASRSTTSAAADTPATPTCSACRSTSSRSTGARSPRPRTRTTAAGCSRRSSSFGRDLSLTVIANGIETTSRWPPSRRWAARWRRAPSLGKPAPADAVEGLLDADLPAVAHNFPDPV